MWDICKVGAVGGAKTSHQLVLTYVSVSFDSARPCWAGAVLTRKIRRVLLSLLT